MRWVAQGCRLLSNSRPREGSGLGLLPGNGTAMAMCGLGEVGSQGDTGWSRLISPSQCCFQIGLAWGDFDTGKVLSTYRLQWKGSQQRNNGGCLSSPHPSATWLGLSLYVPHAPRAADFLLEPRVSVCGQVSVPGPFKEDV